MGKAAYQYKIIIFFLISQTGNTEWNFKTGGSFFNIFMISIAINTSFDRLVRHF
jgi:hypothetical protein